MQESFNVSKPVIVVLYYTKKMTMSFRRLCKVFSLCLSAGIASIFIAAASAQTTSPATELAGAGDELAFGLIPRQGTVVAHPIAVSDNVQHSLFSHPALHLKTVGAVVQAGTVLAEIVPEE